MAQTRVDIAMLYAVLDVTLTQRGVSWRQAARQMGLSPSTLSRLGRGHSPNIDAFVTMLQWLNLPASAFTVDAGRRDTQRPTLAAELAAVLHSRDDLHQRETEHLQEIIATTLQWFDDRRRQIGADRVTARRSPARVR